MEYSCASHDGGLAVHIKGRMTHADYKKFREILQRINDDSPQRIIFDLAGVDFVDSSALGMLLIVRDAAVQQSRTVVLKGGTGQVAKLINISKLHKYFEIE
ncbi:STAS domain-containing protein [Magnetospirillum sp. UT-4]|uniref:STAS domain-containing protein n=1 Tax=Magnetospirillum sp. UT-4 TaxID=2681467 RepID=UPI0013831BDB|nr:STAS domain-containing protein [Magnetospirillum sp. UT-4]CAA7617226.1 Anti-sigma-factor antagonist [Magnetospirillum sp. UT-4]